ncbi:MAG: ATP-binding protein [Lachnospiraceae bacterium]
MRHSIGTRISFIVFGCFLCMVAAVIFLNTVFLDDYYFRDKEKTFDESYQIVDSSIKQYNEGSISAEDLQAKLEGITARTGISIMILNSDWSIVYASMRDVEGFMGRLQNSLFTKILTGDDVNRIKGLKTVVQGENYAIYEIYNAKMEDTYLELIGNVDDGMMVYLSLAVKSIQENVEISNRFISYVGLVVAVIIAIAAFWIGRYTANPIRELSGIAERMAELDFDAKYTRNDKSEIGDLGNSMNRLSEKLESTISELKRANVELQKDIETKEQIDEMRRDFLSNVSHELKTPIALIQGYAEGLKEGITDDPESTAFYCDVIMDEASRMNTMVKKLLSLNQIEFGKDQLEMDRFDLVQVLKAVIASNKLLAEQKGVQIEFEENEPVIVWADEYKIEEVITNYLTNAINHCDGREPIKVCIHKEEQDHHVARVSVYNSGSPIPEESLTQIWDKFYKVDKARTREYGGSGIGLSIVKAIMEQLKQEYGVRNLKNGVEFWFELDAENEIPVEEA